MTTTITVETEMVVDAEEDNFLKINKSEDKCPLIYFVQNPKNYSKK